MKDKIGISEIDKLCELSALEFSDDEKKTLVKEVSDIIQLLKQCDDVEIDSIIETPSVGLNELRDDECVQSMPIEDVLQNAPKARKEHFNVPKVVE